MNLNKKQIALLLFLSVPLILSSMVGISSAFELESTHAFLTSDGFKTLLVMTFLVMNIVVLPVVAYWMRLTNVIYDRGVTLKSLEQEEDEHKQVEVARG